MKQKPIVLEVNNLSVRIGQSGEIMRPVQDVSFDIRKGETFALVGESGCGKSMTALAIMRLLPDVASIETGEVLLEGANLTGWSEEQMRRIRGGRIAMIFQEPMTSLNPVMRVGDQIMESIRYHQGFNRKQARQHAIELMDAVRIPDAGKRIDDYPHQLSGGMKQRIMIAIALAGKPELLIADEPTTALDVTIQAQVLDLLKDLQRQMDMSVLFITHDLGVVAEIADRVGVMYAGEIVELGTAGNFIKHSEHPYSTRLFRSLPSIDKRGHQLDVIPGSVPTLSETMTGCRFEPRCDRSMHICCHTVPFWNQLSERSGVRCHLADPGLVLPESTGARVQESQPGLRQRSEVQTDSLLEIEDLKVHFPIHAGLFRRVVGHVKAVDGVTLDIPRGRTLALVGESGCGKTTLGKGILQLLKPNEGAVLFDGDNLMELRGEQLRKRRSDFQIVFQDPYASMNPRMSIGEILQEGMKAQGYGANNTERRQRATALLQQVGLPADILDRYPHQFSGGQRQRICIARALAVEPKLIICDEPTSALDVSVQAQILNLLAELQDSLGITYLFITHNISVVAYLADEVAVMYLGRIVERGPVEKVLRDPKHPYTRALLSAVPTVDTSKKKQRICLEGDLPSASNPPKGCHFHARCDKAMPVCVERYPDVSEIGASHETRCFLYSDSVT